MFTADKPNKGCDMYISRGTYRLVLAIPEIGIVLKFPIIRIPPIREFRYWDKAQRIFNKPGIESSSTLNWKAKLFHGLYENFSEWLFWLKSHHPICLPTYFSFFGLFNIQKYGEMLGEKYRTSNTVWSILEQIAKSDQEMISQDTHHFNGNNFSGSFGLKMFDYGLKKTQTIILTYGTELKNKFDSRKAD